MLKNAVNKFQILLYNEENSPEILPYDYNTIFFFKETIFYQCNKFPKKKNFLEFFDILKKIELDRIIYIIKTYHRIRIWKIEKNFCFDRTGINLFDLLNISEKKYARAYCFFFLKNLSKIFFIFCTCRIKSRLKVTARFFFKNIKKNEESYVFFRVLKKKYSYFEQTLLSAAFISSFYQNDIYCMKFNHIRRLILSGIVFLQ